MGDELGKAFDVISVAGFGSCALPKVQDGGQVACPGDTDRCHSPNLPRCTTTGARRQERARRCVTSSCRTVSQATCPSQSAFRSPESEAPAELNSHVSDLR